MNLLPWTDDRVEALRRLWTDGLSCSQIVKQIGGCTRNSVIGKVHRLGLSGRATPSRPRRAAPTRRPGASLYLRRREPKAPVIAPTKPTMDAMLALRLPPEAQPDGSFANVLTITDHMCKWPVGDPADAAFAFCGRARKHGPYCADHASVAAMRPLAASRRREKDTNILTNVAWR